MNRENIKRYYPAIFVTLIVIVVAAAGTLIVAINMRSAARQQFVSAADVGVNEIQSDIKSDKSDGQSIAQSYTIAAQQSRASQADYQPRLKLLYDNITRRDVDMVMVGVALRVAGGDRAGFEQTLSSELAKAVVITAMDDNGVMKPDVIRTEYFPIAFVEPQTAAASHVGMNIATDKIINDALNRAKATASPAVSATTLVRKSGRDVNGYCVAVPISAPDQTGAGNLPIGYVIEYDVYRDLLAEVSTDGEGFAGMAIFDSGAAMPTKPVATIGGVFNGKTRLSALLADNANYVQKIDLKSHSWTIVAVPNPGDPIQARQLAAISAANIAFIILIALYMFSSTSRALVLEEMEANLRKSYDSLTFWAEKSERRNNELTMLREMTDMLQACDSSSEAFLVMSLFMYKLFKPWNGAIYILDMNKAKADLKVGWGKDSPENKTFGINDCIALKRSEIYRMEDASSGPVCAHIQGAVPSSYVCLPLMSQGEIFGLFYLADNGPDGEILEEDDYVLATTISEQLAMTLSNITLRERLKEQTLTDHLTSLFNRRFMEDMLEREIRRADRNNQSIGFIMLDIDFFKDINDTYGHDAGDRVLETLGIFLKTSVRMEDIACRYGGEEFLLVMPGSDRANTAKRADEIIEKVKQISIDDNGKALPSIHLSAGVSIYPEDSKGKEEIVTRADEALYEAKRTGRDKVVVWTDIKKKPKGRGN